MPPETRYAKSGDLNIAYQVVGDGPFDLVYVPGWVSNVELHWEKPKPARLLERLASRRVPLRPGRQFPRPRDGKPKDKGNKHKHGRKTGKRKKAA